MNNSIASIYKKHTISVRQALLAFAAFTLLGLAFASCGKTPYEPGIYTISFAEDSGITASPNIAMKGDKIQLTIADRPGYAFGGWQIVKPVDLVIEKDNTFIMPDGEVEILPVWIKDAFSITVNSGGAPSATAGKIAATEDEVITLKHGMYPGYTFVKWDVVAPPDLIINDDGTFNDNYTFTMPAAKVEVTAVWDAIPYTITVNDGAGGSGAAADKTTATVTEAVQLTRGTPDTGYEFDAWAVSPAGVVIGADDTFAMPADNVEVTATWKKTDYTIMVDSNGGTGTAASQQTANFGDSITLTRGSHEVGITFFGWEVVQPQGLTINNDDTFTMPAANVVIAAKWNAVNYNITVADGTGGSGSAADKPTAIIKTTVQLTRGTEQAGYEFDKWSISPASVFIGADDTFVMPAG
ncbi:MAG: InlB B-repeat-containing protein, partial [Treponema sp.]|nr:InlB B-repeat-containing protein [Treponema sp.]